MGYTTYFDGSVKVEPPLDAGEVARINAFADERHEGEGFPGIWCQWIAVTSEEGETYIEWDGGEKFYNADVWMDYIMEHFIRNNGHLANGIIYAEGEEAEDIWRIVVKDNDVKVEEPTITWPEE